ncbi:MAG: hypothetical protein EOP48_09540 [Sphingobacteriales bacterium]|nr:MAG: hypothetical protein EOP48_09540 [Sphingobacteriales bacterium]
MKSLLILISFSTTFLLSSGQSYKDRAFVLAVKEVVNSIATGDSVRLNRWIDQKTGVYILSKYQQCGAYNHMENLGFSAANFDNDSSLGASDFYTITFEIRPKYNCKEKRWQQCGIFVDSVKTDRLLSTTVLNDRCMDSSYPFGFIRKVQKVEESSRRVVIANNKGKSFIFYLSYLEDKWQLTVVDGLTTLCSFSGT